HDVRLGRIDGVRRTELLREGELVVEEVAGDDHPGPGEARALYDVQADPAAAITTTEAPDSTWAHRVTAPTPVGTQQPSSAACAQGISFRIGTSISAGQTTRSPKVPIRPIWSMPRPFRRSRYVSSSCIPRAAVWPSQRIVRPVEQ